MIRNLLERRELMDISPLKITRAGGYLTPETRQTLITAFGSVDGELVFQAAESYCETYPDRAKFINEDPYVVCSLDLNIPTLTTPLPYRWLYNGNDEYGVILTNLQPKTTSIVDIIYKIHSNNRDYPYVFGSENYDRTSRFGLWSNGSTVAPRIWSWSNNISYSHLNKVMRIERRADGYGYLNGGQQTLITPVSNITYKVKLFAMNYRDLAAQGDGGPINGSINRFDMDGNLFVPWTLKSDRDASKCYPQTATTAGNVGMMNLTTDTFHRIYDAAYYYNFSMNYTLADGTTPWTPPT